jgi:transcriptional regulator with XRE-family HTH domain
MVTNYLNGGEQENYGSVIREAREKKEYTQEELGALIGVTARSIGEWERGGGSPSQDHKQALVECLEIEPELIGLLQRRDFSPQEASACYNRTTSYLDMAMFNSAFISSDFLVRNLRRLVKQGDKTLLKPLIDALHVAGHTVSIARNNAEQALIYYQRMEHYVLQLEKDDPMRPTLLSLARTYQGEMRRRKGDIEGAIRAFKNAPQGPEVDVRVKGNRAQLSARPYMNLGDPDSIEEARRQLDRSFELLSEVKKSDSGIYVCYNLCGTYLAYAQFHRDRNNIKESLRYIELAEQNVSQAPRWRIPVLITKGLLLINRAAKGQFITNFSMDAEFKEGVSLLVDAIELARKAGHRRQLSQIARIKNNLFHRARDYFDAGHQLGEKLDDLDE